MSMNQGWSEVLPAQQYVVPQNITAPNGSMFYADTTYAGSSKFYFTMQDYGNGDRLYYSVTANGYSGATAEQIAERPTVSGSYSNLSNFNSVTFQGSGAAKDSGMYLLSNYSRHKVLMYNPNTGNYLTHVSDLNSAGDFTVYHDHCK